MKLQEFFGPTKEAYDLLFNDFEPLQVFELEEFDNARKNGHYQMFYFFDSDKNRIGYAFCAYAGENTVLLDYIGISEEFRGKGLGSELLRQLLDFLHPKGVLVEYEPEPPGGNPKNSRDRFFGKIGLIKQNVNYTLPETDGINVANTPYTICYRSPDGKNIQLGAAKLREMFGEYTEKVLSISGAMPTIEDVI
ncbi:MAG: GNAT family N-acetyltransferase [Clostridiales bacterium]|jgi:GNAT superfamily N-acetyltransferase|nr:GNAT family N-acetyltransferase [Clostridiales bacterium]